MFVVHPQVAIVSLELLLGRGRAEQVASVLDSVIRLKTCTRDVCVCVYLCLCVCVCVCVRNVPLR